MPKRSRRGLVSMPARVVAPASVNGGRSSLIERAAGPSPIMMSIWKSSSAGYRISSTTGDRRWISSMNNTSLGSRFVRMAARSPGRSRTGPEVWRRLTPISRAMMCASVVLPSPGGPNSSTWSSASPRARAAWMKISSWPRIFSCPTYSARVPGRSERSNCSSCAEVGLAEISRSVSTLTPAFCPRTKEAAFSMEAPNEADADDIYIGFAAGIVASDTLIALPFCPDARFAGHIVLCTEAKRQIGVSVLEATGSQSRHGRAYFRLGTVGAKFSVNGKLIGKRVGAKTDELRRVRFDIAAHPRCTKRHPAKIVVAELRGEVAVDPVAAKNPERGSFGVATTKTGAIEMASFGLSNRSAHVPPCVAACLRRAHGRSRHHGGTQHCCNKCLIPCHASLLAVGFNAHPGILPQKKKGGMAALFSKRYCWLLEPIDQADAEYINIGIPFGAGRVVTCLHLRIPLPFSAHTEVATEVVLDSPAVSHISRVLFSATETAQLSLGPIEAEPPENRELVREGESTDRGKIPSIRFNINRTVGTAGFYFA